MTSVTANTDELIIITCFIMLALLMLCFFFIFFFIRFKEKQTAFIKSRMQLTMDYEQAILNAQLEIQEQTLLSVSQEIHDNIGQTLTVAKLYLNNDEQYNDSDKPNVKTLISKAIHDLRQLSKTLNSDRIKQIGFIEALKHDVEMIKQSNQIKMQLEIDGNHFLINDQVELILYRVCQEIITNILKHAAAKEISIHLHSNANELKIDIIDDGKGFDVPLTLGVLNANQGVGLQNIYKRVAMINGTIKIDSELGVGTQHHIKIKNQ